MNDPNDLPKPVKSVVDCDHKGENSHHCQTVWFPDVKRFGLRVAVTCIACGLKFQFAPTDPIMRLRLDEGDTVLKVVLK